MKIKLSGNMRVVDTSHDAAEVASICRWYDRKARSWVVQRRNANDYQIGDVYHCHRESEAISVQNQWRNDLHNSANVELTKE